MRNITTVNDILLSTSSVPLLMKSMMRNPVISGFEDLEADHVWWSGEGEGPPDIKSLTAVTSCLNLSRWFSNRKIMDESFIICIPRNNCDRVLTNQIS